MKNHNPYESTEYQDKIQWRHKVYQNDLAIVPCVSAWFDICGYGQVLENAQWKLESLRDSGLFKSLSLAYELLGHPMIVGAPPMPSERILIINDGIARTADMADREYIDPLSIIVYLRELLTKHFLLQTNLIKHSLGLRTVLAGGERCQYSPNSVTGESILFHSGSPSEFGKSLLSQQFVYHPAEFQMNTAFAMAYTIESLGSKSGIKPNRMYITDTWLEKINKAMPEPSKIGGTQIFFTIKGQKLISIEFDERLTIKAKGFSTEVFKVCKFTVHKPLEGEETSFSMAEYDASF